MYDPSNLLVNDKSLTRADGTVTKKVSTHNAPWRSSPKFGILQGAQLAQTSDPPSSTRATHNAQNRTPLDWQAVYHGLVHRWYKKAGEQVI